MAYSITVNLLPSGCSFYVKADSTNPTTIEDTATLKFYADGTYYVMNSSQASAVSVTGASVASWTRNSLTQGTLVINNPTGDVVVNITAKQVVSPMNYNRPFNLNVKAPIDTRLVLTKVQMSEIADSKMPDYYFCICKDDSKLYVYDKSLTKDATTGRFRPIDNYLTFTSEEAKEKLNEAIANSVKISEINQEITEIQGDVTSLQTDVASVESRVDVVEPKVTTLETKVGDEASGLVKRVNDAEQSLDELEPRIDTAEEDIEVIQTWINNVKLDGGEIKAYYALTANYTNVTPDVTPTQIQYNTSLTITFTANTGYVLPDSVTVNETMVGSEQVDCGKLSAKWIKSTGKLYLINVLGEVSYTVNGTTEE